MTSETHDKDPSDAILCVTSFIYNLNQTPIMTLAKHLIRN